MKFSAAGVIHLIQSNNKCEKIWWPLTYGCLHPGHFKLHSLTEQGALTETGNNTISFSVCFIPAFKNRFIDRLNHTSSYMHTSARLKKSQLSCLCTGTTCKANNSELSNASLPSELGASRNADLPQNLPKTKRITTRTQLLMISKWLLNSKGENWWWYLLFIGKLFEVCHLGSIKR